MIGRFFSALAARDRVNVGIRALLDIYCSYCTYAPMIYMAPCVMLLMRAASITRESGRGLGPGNRYFFLKPCPWVWHAFTAAYVLNVSLTSEKTVTGIGLQSSEYTP